MTLSNTTKTLRKRSDSGEKSSHSTTKGSPIRVLIADDHPTIIEGLTSILSRSPLALEVVGHATSTAAVIEQYRAVNPDVVVLDVRFGEGPTGLDVARELLSLEPQARIIFYSQFDQDEIIQEAYRLGGAAFITKNTMPTLLAEVIQQVHAGDRYFLREIAERLAMLGIQGEASPQSKLDERELEVFKMIAMGFTSAEIAGKMDLSTKTIGTIHQSIKDLLGLQRSADFTRLAAKHFLIDL